MKLLAFLFFFIFAYYVFKKYIFPYLLRTFIRKAQEKFSNFQQNPEPEEIKNEGEVSVKYVPPEAKKNKFNPENSTDVDFEEIKE